jgi:peptide chain release factor
MMIRLLLTSGRGPAECRIALTKTLGILASEAEVVGVTVDVSVGHDPDGHGPASAIAVIEGAGADAFVATWIGSVLWVARSRLRPHHKRKNWFIGVFKLEVSPSKPVPLKLADVHFEALRAGGPGGQHQNKTESAVRAVHAPTGLVVVARDGRSQHRNKAIALERLALLVKLNGELAEITDRERIQSDQALLERGRPVRTFKGERF